MDVNVKQEIIKECAYLFGLDVEELVGRSHMQHICKARFALYKAFHLRGWSYSAVGRAIGGRDHTTIINGIARAEYWMEKDPRYARRIERLVTMQPERLDPAYLPPEPEPEPEPENILKDFLYD